MENIGYKINWLDIFEHGAWRLRFLSKEVDQKVYRMVQSNLGLWSKYSEFNQIYELNRNIIFTSQQHLINNI